MTSAQIVALFVLGLCISACGGGGGSSPEAPMQPPMDVLAANGWPVSNAPQGYVGTGFAVGDLMSDLIATDQHGSTDVALSQFYGSMIVVALDAPWSVFSVMGAEAAEETRRILEDESDLYRVTYVSALADPGTISEAEADSWVTTHGLTGPVLRGQSVADFFQAVGTRSFPTYLIVDPSFQIRDLVIGWVGAEALRVAVRDAWSAFRTANPDWTSPFINN